METGRNKIGLRLANSTSPKGTQMVGADPLLIEGIVLKLSEIRSLQTVKPGVQKPPAHIKLDVVPKFIGFTSHSVVEPLRRLLKLRASGACQQNPVVVP